MHHCIAVGPLTRVAAGLLLSLALHLSQAAGEGGTSQGRRPLAPDDFYRIADVSDPRMSPDGFWVAYVVTTNDRETDSAKSAIWMAAWDGSQRLALTPAAEGTGKPRWSPDGRYLAFLAAAAGSDKGQIMLLDRRGGDARPLTHVAGDIGEYAWAPDGKRLAYSMAESESVSPPKPIVIEALHFKQDEEGYIGRGRERHLYVLETDTSRTEQLTSDPQFNEDLPAWSPEGRRIAFIRTHEHGPDQDGREDIDVMDAEPAAAPQRIVRPYAPNAQRLAWSPDGSLIAYLQGLEPKFNAYMQDRLAVARSSGGEPRQLAVDLDRAVTSFAFNADSKSMMITVEDDRSAYLETVDIARGSASRNGPAGAFVVSALSSAGGHTAVLHSNDGTLAEVYALEAGRLRKLSAQNDALLSELSLGSAEDVEFKSRDGAEIHGIMIKPPSFVPGRRYPMLLWIHGGPNEQDEHSLVLDGYQFEKQMFAARGFVVLRVNYRGGAGRGLAFAKAIFADWGHKEVEDLLAGVDYLVGRGIADPARLAVGGWSYGGILTDYIIASDRRFKAAISGAGSADQLATYGSDQYVLQYNNELGPPWRDPALWLKVSYPFFHADRIHTPTLFVGGDKDFNVPLVGGEQMYEALRTLGVPAQLVVYPGQHHVFTRPSFLKDLAERMAAWLDRFLALP